MKAAKRLKKDWKEIEANQYSSLREFAKRHVECGAQDSTLTKLAWQWLKNKGVAK